MNAPCKDCPERHYLCHMECPEYLVYRAERDRINEERMSYVGVVWADEAKQRASRKKLNTYKRNH